MPIASTARSCSSSPSSPTPTAPWPGWKGGGAREPPRHGIPRGALMAPRPQLVMLQVPTLAERLHAHGLRLAAVSSGSTGSAWLLDHRAAAGIGALVNGYFEAGRTVAYPADLNAALLAKFGPAPAKPGGGERYDAAVGWMLGVLREHVLPALAPSVVFAWLTEPDHSQHALGVGAPSARAAVRNADREIA